MELKEIEVKWHGCSVLKLDQFITIFVLVVNEFVVEWNAFGNLHLLCGAVLLILVWVFIPDEIEIQRNVLSCFHCL